MQGTSELAIHSLQGNKVEGAKTNTPPKTNTYKRLPIANILLP
jgi:hypothetical protein